MKSIFKVRKTLIPHLLALLIVVAVTGYVVYIANTSSAATNGVELTVASPYTNYAKWYKGNLHDHSEVKSKQWVADYYGSHGYGFYTLSDHNSVTSPAANSGTAINIGRAEELDTYGKSVSHTLISTGITSGVSGDASGVAQAVKSGAIVVLNHFNNFNKADKDRQTLHTPGVTGMEVCNGKRQDQIANYTREWDSQLNQGYKLWGFGADDGHESSEFGQCYISVNSSQQSPNAGDIINNIKSGNFYAGRAGGSISSVKVSANNVITVQTNGANIRWIQNGVNMGTTNTGGSATYEPTAGNRYDASKLVNYVRFEVLNNAGSPIAWSQPMYINVAKIKPTLGPNKPVYRFRNIKNGYYLWNFDLNEANNIIATQSNEWRYEGVAYNINTNNSLNRSTLWRFRNISGGYYLYTADKNEKDNIISNLSTTWKYEGPAFRVAVAPTLTSKTVWRFSNLQNGSYFYTADTAEKDNIVRTLANTWKLEGPAFYLAK